MILNFTKMHGAGNDYIYFSPFANPGVDFDSIDWSSLSIRLSDRHFGIGGDGIVLILPSSTADFRMRIFNADGSEAEMCGNASRCIGRYVQTKHLTEKTDVTLETLCGIKYIHLADLISVRMGQAKDVHPVLSGTFVDMGNPHAVFFVDEITDTLVLGEGPKLEVNPVFPHRANIEFARPIDTHNVQMRVWERGSGETLACGTGACATAVAAIANGLCTSPVTVHLVGGDLTIDVDTELNVTKTGPATVVFEGTIEI